MWEFTREFLKATMLVGVNFLILLLLLFIFSCFYKMIIIPAKEGIKEGIERAKKNKKKGDI